MMKKLISVLLTALIAVICFLYTYSSYNLPFRSHAFTVTSNDGSIDSLYDLIKAENLYRDTPINVSADFRNSDVAITGKIVVEKVEQDGDYIKVISKYPYFDFGKPPLLMRLDEDDACYENSKIENRYIVIYFPIDNINLYEFFGGKKIVFKAKFNKINSKYIICSEGEVL